MSDAARVGESGSPQEVLERAWEAIRDGGPDALAPLLASDARWLGVQAGWECEGRASILERMRAARAFRPAGEIAEQFVCGGRIAVGFRPERPPAAERPLEHSIAWVVATVDDGLIVELRGFTSRAQALQYAREEPDGSGSP